MRKRSSAMSGPFLRRACLVDEGFERTRHPFDIRAFAAGIDIDFAGSVTFFVGENGSGKSTLIEAIARKVGFPAQGGARDHDPGVLGEGEGELASALRLSWLPKVNDGFFMRAESFFNFATYIDQVSSLSRYGGVPLHEQSHGESFLALFAHRFERGIFLLDEPEAALSPQRQLAFLKIIHDLDIAGRAQFIICSHSPILLAYPGAQLLSLDGDGIAPIAYQETHHYQVTKQFLDSPERFFKHLFAAGAEEEP